MATPKPGADCGGKAADSLAGSSGEGEDTGCIFAVLLSSVLEIGDTEGDIPESGTTEGPTEDDDASVRIRRQRSTGE